jgi:thiosulfate dehydrogenase [quinone] large subunit
MVDIAKNHNRTAGSTTGPLLDAPPTPRPTPHLNDGQRDRRGPVVTSATTSDSRSGTAVRYLLAGIRLALGWIFLWAFLDKMFGLGHETVAAKSWLNGGSPTKGFLGSAAKGPFAGFYHSIAGAPITNVLFMAALLGVGVALILGIGMRLAAAGALLTIMMWTAVLPPASNPVMDDHLIYAAVLIVLALLGAGNTLGLGRMWASLPLVRRATWLK